MSVFFDEKASRFVVSNQQSMVVSIHRTLKDALTFIRDNS